jgi:hypothetical protein
MVTKIMDSDFPPERWDASDYQGKDPKKWLGDLSKAIKEVEAALADTKNKLAATQKAFKEYVDARQGLAQARFARILRFRRGFLSEASH